MTGVGRPARAPCVPSEQATHVCSSRYVTRTSSRVRTPCVHKSRQRILQVNIRVVPSAGPDPLAPSAHRHRVATVFGTERRTQPWPTASRRRAIEQAAESRALKRFGERAARPGCAVIWCSLASWPGRASRPGQCHRPYGPGDRLVDHTGAGPCHWEPGSVPGRVPVRVAGSSASAVSTSPATAGPSATSRVSSASKSSTARRRASTSIRAGTAIWVRPQSGRRRSRAARR